MNCHPSQNLFNRSMVCEADDKEDDSLATPNKRDKAFMPPIPSTINYVSFSLGAFLQVPMQKPQCTRMWVL